MSAAKPTGGELVIESDGSNTFQSLAKDHYLTERLAGALRSKNPSLAHVELEESITAGVAIHLPYFLAGRATKPGERYVVDQSVRLCAAQIVVMDQSTGRYVVAPPESIKEEMVVRQWVNLDTKDEGLDGCGSEINLLIGPVGIHTNRSATWPSDGVVNISVTFAPPHKETARCERTEPAWGVFPSSQFTIHPVPQIDASGKATSNLAVSAREKKFRIAKQVKAGDPPMRLKIALGVGGGDACLVETGFVQGVSDAVRDSVVRFVNWRKIFYSLLAPLSVSRILEQDRSGKWDLHSDIKSDVREAMNQAYIEVERKTSQVFTPSESLLGAFPAKLVGQSSGFAYAASVASVSQDAPYCNFLDAPITDTREVRICLADKLIGGEEKEPKILQKSSKSLKSSFTISESVKKDAEGKYIVLPYLIKKSKVGNGFEKISSLNFKVCKWKSDLDPAKYYMHPVVEARLAGTFDSQIEEPPTHLIQVLSAEGVPMKDKEGNVIRCSIYCSDSVIPDAAKKAIKQFANKTVKYSNICGRVIRYQIFKNTKIAPNRKDLDRMTVQHSEDVNDSKAGITSEARIISITEAIKTAVEKEKKFYLHPGLNEDGSKKSGDVDPSWITISGFDEISIEFPNQKAGDPGVFVGQESGEKCPISWGCEFSRSREFSGLTFNESVKKRTGTIFIRPAIDADEISCKKIASRTICHELGHLMGMAPFFNADGQNTAAQVPGMAKNLNVDEIVDIKTKERGNYYNGDGSSDKKVVENGFRRTQVGPHCAAGLESSDKFGPDFSGLLLQATCLMFGTSDQKIPKAGSFCQECRQVLKSRMLKDLHSSWAKRC